MRRVAVALACLSLIAAIAVPALASAHPLPGAPGCPVFPPNNPWNQRVDRLPVAKNSAALIASIGLDDPVHPDFGSGLYNGEPIGIPYTVVSSSTRKVPVTFQYASESDKGPYPLPRGVPIEGGYGSTGDRHVIVVDRSTCTDYELFAAYPHDGGTRWTAGLGRDLQPALESPAARRLDLGRRRRPADPPRPRPLRRGRGRVDRPRAPLHRAVHGAAVRVPGAPRSVHVQRRRTCRRWASAFG